MSGPDKQQILDALFDEPGMGSKRQDKEYLRAHTLFFESGIRPRVDEFAPRRIWQKYHGNQGVAPAQRKSRRYWIPAIAAASVVLAIGIVGLVRDNNRGSADAFRKQATKRENFAEQYQGSVNLYVRQTENFSVNHHGVKFEIAADTITARIDFKATEAIKTVRIQTPQVTFEIIGTRIALEVTPGKARLHVNEGKVRVSYAGRSEIVEEGEIWEYSQASARKTDETLNDEKIFAQLKSDLVKSAVAAAPKPQPRARYVRIQLNDGTEISGRLVRENSEMVVISAPLAGNQEILLKRENIRSLSNEGGKR